MLNFSRTNPVLILNIPIQTPSVKALNPLNRFTAIFVKLYMGSQNPLIYY
jgi:hypothetical protein